MQQQRQGRAWQPRARTCSNSLRTAAPMAAARTARWRVRCPCQPRRRARSSTQHRRRIRCLCPTWICRSTTAGTGGRTRPPRSTCLATHLQEPPTGTAAQMRWAAAGGTGRRAVGRAAAAAGCWMMTIQTCCASRRHRRCQLTGRSLQRGRASCLTLTSLMQPSGTRWVLMLMLAGGGARHGRYSR